MNFPRNGFRISLASAVFATALMASSAVHAANIVIVNNDGAGEGFNDPTPAAPVGGNPGTTIGQQRLNAFQYAANVWGDLLASNVTIRVRGQWDPLTCNAGGGILGSAGATSFYRDFAGAPVAATWYPVALASSLFGSDLNPADDDINATFNSDWGNPDCGAASGWYYGFDQNGGGSLIDFPTVLIHEMGHGLGFLTIVNLATGAKALGFDDIYMRFLEDHNGSPSDYPSMSNAQRVAASIDTGNLHWTGANLRAASGILQSGKVGDHVRMFAPNPAQLGSSVSHFDTVLTPNQLMEPSYAVPIHNPVLEPPLFQDIGWTLLQSGEDLLADFGAPGLFQFLNNSTFQKISNASPVATATGDLDGGGQDEAIASFGNGLWARYNNSTWVKLHNASPTRFVAGDLDGNGQEDLVVDFGASGLWVRYNNGTWLKRSNLSSQLLAKGDVDDTGNDDIIVDFGGPGLWQYRNNSSWQKINNASPIALAAGNLDGAAGDEVIASFGNGLWARYNNSTWVKLHNASPTRFVAGDLDGNGQEDLVVGFGASGLWVRYNDSTWVKRHNANPQDLETGDLNNSGQEELIVDFGSLGLWARYNNGTWTKLTNANAQGLATGGFD